MNYKHIFDDSILLIFTEEFNVKNSADNIKAKIREELSEKFDIVENKSKSDSKAKIEISATIHIDPTYLYKNKNSYKNIETIKSISLTANLFDNEGNEVLTLDSSINNELMTDFLRSEVSSTFYKKDLYAYYDSDWSSMANRATQELREKICEWKNKQIRVWIYIQIIKWIKVNKSKIASGIVISFSVFIISGIYLYYSDHAAIKSIKNSTDSAVKEKDLKKTLVTPARKWAVIIGISNYLNSKKNGLTNLSFADDDAKAFLYTLGKLGWKKDHIQLLVNHNATKRNISIALESWLTKANHNDQIVIFWASHGYPNPDDPEKVYFACYDTDIRVPSTGYRMDRVRAALEEKKTKNVILLADTCHTGKLITRGSDSRGISIVPYIRRQDTPKGWIFMVGADTDRNAIEHTSWSNGAFTYSLLKGLNGGADGFQSAGVKDGIVTMGELKSYMNTAMPDETQKVLGVAKHPIITTSSGDPDIWNIALQADQ
jgi:hypothetical protein